MDIRQIKAFVAIAETGTFTAEGYRVDVRALDVQPIGSALLLYARPLSDVDHTLARVQFFLLLGVLGGTILALVGGLWTARQLTARLELIPSADGLTVRLWL